jgi:hypothetical protein
MHFIYIMYFIHIPNTPAEQQAWHADSRCKLVIHLKLSRH